MLSSNILDSSEIFRYLKSTLIKELPRLLGCLLNTTLPLVNGLYCIGLELSVNLLSLSNCILGGLMLSTLGAFLSEFDTGIAFTGVVLSTLGSDDDSVIAVDRSTSIVLGSFSIFHYFIFCYFVFVD
jgi:hypothetical protein